MRRTRRLELRVIVGVLVVGLALLLLGVSLPRAGAQTGTGSSPAIGADRGVDFPYDM